MPRLSPRLQAVVDALPLRGDLRILEIGCGPGAAARAIAGRLSSGHILAIDRSEKAVAEARRAAAGEIASGRMSVRHVAAEDFVLQPGEAPFELVFAIRVGALDGRHPDLGRQVLERIAAATTHTARLFVDGGARFASSTFPGGRCSWWVPWPTDLEPSARSKPAHFSRWIRSPQATDRDGGREA